MVAVALLCALPVLSAAAAPAAQKAALVSLYEALDGPNWASQWGWCQNIRGRACPEFGDPLEFTDPCSDFFDDTLNRFRTWDGIVCDSTDRVVAINLGFNSLDGTDLPDLSALTSLERLFLQSNSIKGSIAGAGWDAMSSLETVHLHSNEFSGPLPASLINNPNVVNLLIFDNEFSGELPEYTAGGSPDLETFRFNDNAFTGSLPASYSAFTSMEGFYGADNELEGVIPDLFFSMVTLKFVDLARNNLIGPVPPMPSWTNIGLAGNPLGCSLSADTESVPAQLDVSSPRVPFSCTALASTGLHPSVIGVDPRLCAPMRISTLDQTSFDPYETTLLSLSGDNLDICADIRAVFTRSAGGPPVTLNAAVVGTTAAQVTVPADALTPGIHTLHLATEAGVPLTPTVSVSAVASCECLPEP